MDNGTERNNASEEMCVFDQRNWNRDELRYILRRLNGLCGMDIVVLSGDDRFVRGARCDTLSDARIELGKLAMKDNGCSIYLVKKGSIFWAVVAYASVII
jgi:hypothetical protein